MSQSHFCGNEMQLLIKINSYVTEPAINKTLHLMKIKRMIGM